MDWLNDLKGWFAGLMSLIRGFETAAKKATEWILNHLYMLLIPVIAAFKSMYDFLSTLIGRIQEKLETIDVASLQLSDGSLGTMVDFLAFFNCFLPLEELFGWAIVLLLFWGVCLLIRTIKGVKQTIAF